jgi:uncharacterized membrane-anchored protein YitT (DUF2179 family)
MILLRKNITTRQILIKDFLFIISGTLALSLGFRLFVLPSNIAIGGLAGLSAVLNYLTEWPAGMVMLLINIPIFALGFSYLGKVFGLRTIVAVVLFSVFTDTIGFFASDFAITSNRVLATAYGGAFIGLGLGLVFRAGASVGGTSVIATILARQKGYKYGYVLMVLDIFIIAFGAWIYGELELALWGIIVVYINSQVIDFVIAGPPTGKVAQIISNRCKEISELVITELHRGGTLLHGTGIFSGSERNVLMVVLDNSEVIPLKHLVQQVDPDAFVVITNAHEILGQGFSMKIKPFKNKN